MVKNIGEGDVVSRIRGKENIQQCTFRCGVFGVVGGFVLLVLGFNSGVGSG